MNCISLKNHNNNNNNDNNINDDHNTNNNNNNRNNNSNGEFVHTVNMMRDLKKSVDLRFELPSYLENNGVSVLFVGEE